MVSVKMEPAIQAEYYSSSSVYLVALEIQLGHGDLDIQVDQVERQRLVVPVGHAPQVHQRDPLVPENPKSQPVLWLLDILALLVDL